MILGYIHDFDTKGSIYSPIIKRLLDYLRNTDFSILKDSKYDIEPGISAKISSYDTIIKEERVAESHKRNIDLHYIISGQENMGTGLFNLNNEIVEQYNEKDDYILYGKVKDEIYYPLKKGSYVILFPSDVHRVGCNLDGEEKVRKIVIKIPVDKL